MKKKVTIDTLALPKIKSLRPKKRNPRLGLYLTKEEKNFLFRKHVSEGMGTLEARKAMHNCRDTLNKLIHKLREEKKSEEEISVRFKEEFAKMIDR